MFFYHKGTAKQNRKALFSALLLCFSITTTLFSRTAAAASDPIDLYHWPAGPQISAEGAILIEAETGAVLFEKNATEAFYPASTTKLMTVLLALENSALGETVTASHDAVYNIEQGYSRLWVNEGEELSMEDSLYAVMLPSANDLAYAIAEHIGGSMEAFADMMNARAKELGCVNTHFTNSYGREEEEHYSCPADLARIMRALIKIPTFVKISGSKNHQIPATNLCAESRWVLNTHQMLSGAYDYEGVIAGKTGYTTLAGKCLVTCAKRGSMTLISVILKASDDTSLYDDTAALLNYGFNNFTTYSIGREQLSLDTAFPPLFNREDSVQLLGNAIVSTESGYVVLPTTAALSDTKKSVSLTQLTSFAKGKNIIGRISYTYGTRTVGFANIIYNNSEEPFSLDSSVSGPEAVNPSGEKDKTEENSRRDRRPLTIGIFFGCTCFFIGIYLVFVEIPYRRKRASYLAKHKNESH